MGIDDSSLSFYFDEAMYYIESQMYYDENGKLQWHQEPCWLKEYTKKQLPKNNDDLIKRMLENLKKYEN